MELICPTRHPGQGLAEYGLILAIVAVVAVAGLLIFGGTVSTMMSTLGHTVTINV